MITVTIEGDEDGVVVLLQGHIAAFFGLDLDVSEPAEYVRMTLDGRAGKILADETVKIASVYNAGVLYRGADYMSAETPYSALWRSLQALLPPRIYDMLYRDFKLKNAAYSKKKYNETKQVKQERMF